MPRQAMFKGGVGSPDRHYFDTSSESFRFLKRLIALRKAGPVFRRGSLEILRDDPRGPGVLAYRLAHEGVERIILMNTSGEARMLDNLEVGLPPGSLLTSKFSLVGEEIHSVVDEQGAVNVVLAPYEVRCSRSEALNRRSLPPPRDSRSTP